MRACIFAVAKVKEFPMMQQAQFDLFLPRCRQVVEPDSLTEMGSRSSRLAFRDLLDRLMRKYSFNQVTLAAAIEPDPKKWPATQGTVSQVLAGKRGVPLNNLDAWTGAMPVTAEEKANLYNLALREWAPDYVQHILNDFDTATETLRGILVWLGSVVGVDFFDYTSPEVQKKVDAFINEISKGKFPPATIKKLRIGFMEMIIKSGITKE